MSGNCTSFLCVFPKLSTDLCLSLWKPKFWLCDVLVDTELTVHCVPFYCLYFQSSLPLGLGPPWHTLEWSCLPCHGGRGTPACLLRMRGGPRGGVCVCVFHVHMSSFQHPWLKTGPPMGSSVSEGLPFSLSSDLHLSVFVLGSQCSSFCSLSFHPLIECLCYYRFVFYFIFPVGIKKSGVLFFDFSKVWGES